MTLGDKLAKLRRENNYTQEQFAEQLGVSRQSVSKWESDLSYPETDKLIRIGEMFGCSMDYLLKDSVDEPDGAPAAAAESTVQSGATVSRLNLTEYYYERRSKHTVFGMPLVHVNVGMGRTAKGFIAIGLKAKGIISIGLLSLGVVSVGILSLGVLAFGAAALGLIAGGAIAVGAIAAGAIAIGILAMGALSIGQVTAGALSIGRYFAIGYDARGMIAVGDEKFSGSLFSQKLARLSNADRQQIITLFEDNAPSWLQWCKGIIRLFLGS